MKKYMILLVSVLAFGMAACQKEADTAAPATDAAATSAEAPKSDAAKK